MRATDVFEADAIAAQVEHRKEPSGNCTVERHPAFGVIGASRVSSSGGDVLFGSDFDHHHYVTITIQNSSLRRDLSHDWIHGDGYEYIRVALSEAQWATFVSTLNVGDGVPCTVSRINGRAVPDILRTTNRREHFTNELRQTVEDALAKLAELEQQIRALAIGDKQKDARIKQLGLVRQELQANIPFVVKSFDEHVDRVTERAKIEVSAYMQAAITRAGIGAIAGGDLSAPLALDTIPLGIEGGG